MDVPRKPILLVHMEAEAEKAKKEAEWLAALAADPRNGAVKLDLERRAAWQSQFAKEWEDAIDILRKEWGLE